MAKKFSNMDAVVLYVSHKTGVTVVQQGNKLVARCIKCSGDIYYDSSIAGWYCSERDQDDVEKRCPKTMPLVPFRADNSQFHMDEDPPTKTNIKYWLSHWLQLTQPKIIVRLDGK